jgi:hypothetical protein
VFFLAEIEPENLFLNTELVVGLGLFMLVRGDGSADWYLFANLENPTSSDTSRILGVLNRHGVRTDLRSEGMLKHPHHGLVATGGYEQVLAWGTASTGETKLRLAKSVIASFLCLAKGAAQGSG